MKRPILDIFDDSHSRMDESFKAKLRLELQTAETKGASKKPLSRRLLLVPAFGLALAVIITLAGLNISQSAKNRTPLQPQTVSAAEIIKRSIKASSQFDDSKYTYFYSHQTLTYGPAFSTECNAKGAVPSQQISNFTTYAYRAHDERVEAYYEVDNIPGVTSAPVSVYNDAPGIQILMPFANFSNVQTYLENYIVNGYPVKLFIDKNGQPKEYGSIRPTVKNGRAVYEFYTKPNPKSLGITPSDPFYSCSVDTISYTVIDAASYLPIELSSYRGSVSPENLSGSTTYDTRYENLSQSAALTKMRKAGFDQAAALPEYPSGKDGVGLGDGEGI